MHTPKQQNLPLIDLPIEQKHWLYKNTSCNKYRFLLGQPGTRNLVCFGINPSTAEPNNLDPTLTRVRNNAKAYGFDGWMMLNVYPQRATDPNNLAIQKNYSLHQKNLEWIEKFFATPNQDCILWAAWGTLIDKRTYLFGCLKDIVSIVEKFGFPWKTIGKRSIKGHPHHPLYLKKGLPMDDFCATEYVFGMRNKFELAKKTTTIISRNDCRC